MPPMIDWNLVLTVLAAFIAIRLLPTLLAVVLFCISRGFYWLSEHTGTEEQRRRTKLRNALERYSRLLRR